MIDWVDLHIGLKVSDARLSEFEKGIILAAADSGFEEPSDYVKELIRGQPSESELGFLASYLTVGETYFFRDPLSFDVLKTYVLPEIRQDQDKLKIWSAGCASGEEPYSLAMTMLSAFGKSAQDMTRIIATDVNPRYLNTARTGLYRRWSFRDVPIYIKDTYFNLTPDDRYSLSSGVKRMVDFSFLNLADEKYPSLVNDTHDLDVIFCRNVLIYFSPERVTQVLARFHTCLKDGGWLFLAPSEIPHPAPDNFKVMNMEGAIVLRKDSSVAQSSGLIRIVQSNYSYFGGTPPNMKSFESIVDVDERLSQELAYDTDVDANDSTSQPLNELGSPSAALDVGLGTSDTSGASGPDSASATSEQSAAEASHSAHLELLRSVVESAGAGTNRLSAASRSTLESPANIAQSLYELGEYEKVIEALLEAPETFEQDNGNSIALIARSYANIGNLDAAIDWSERLIESDAVNPRWYYLRATIQQEQGKEQAAQASLRQALFLDHDFVLAYFALGNLLKQQGKSSDANKCFARVLEILKRYDSDVVIEDSDGLMAGQLAIIVKSLVDGGTRP
jgi:Methylase of chemotaxis methyl-accepting proteins